MDHVAVRAKVHRDNTGAVSEIPVILTEQGPLQFLVEYLLLHSHNRSYSWMQKLVQAVGLLLDYISANHDCFEDPEALFQSFVQRLYTGTVGVDGDDPSGLYWLGMSTQVARQLIQILSDFSEWMSELHGAKPLNPWHGSTRSEEMLAWAAWHQKNKRSFLAHLGDRNKASIAIKHERNALLNRTQLIDHDGVKHFPERHVQDLLFKGFIVPGQQANPRIEKRLNLRDILITLLMHYGGLRMSEPFHLYAHDVLPDPFNPDCAYVRVFHPCEGAAPHDIQDAKGCSISCNRGMYLRLKYGMRPRNLYASTDQLHAGWKGNALDSKDHFMNVNWFPTWAGKVFMKLWVLYMAERAQKRCNHPFAFVTKEGKPYAIDSFGRQHRRAVERIGLITAKALGTSPHGHRHAYGQRLNDTDIDPIFIKKALHHKSLESQLVYTEPDRTKLNRLFESATKRLETGETLPAPDLLSYGFEDVDPLGLLSGFSPKLRRK